MDDDEKTRARSPQFPFIPLEKCIVRLREFEAVYGQNAGRPSNVVKTWGYTEKGSGGIQTVAALSGFGLLDDEGSGDSRKLRLSSLAITILKDKRTGAAENAIKAAALKPKVMAELWKEWGANRPPDHECISILHIDKKFREDAAERLLKIYDATIRFAGLADSDKKIDNAELNTELEAEVEEPLEAHTQKVASAASDRLGKVPLMTGERVVFAHELRPNQSFKIVVTGDVDAALLKALEGFAKFQASMLPPPTDKPN